MSLTVPIPRREPQVIAAGDTVEWERQLDDFSATEWTLHYVLRNLAAIYKFDATNDAGLFLVTLTNTTTKAWKPGKYSIGAYVTNAGGEQVQVRTAFPNMTVGPNLAVNPEGHPTISFAAQALASIETTILKLTSRTVDMVSVNGSAYTLANIGKLYELRLRLRSEVNVEESQERLNAGLGAGNKVAIRFRPIAASPWPPSFQVPWQ